MKILKFLILFIIFTTSYSYAGIDDYVKIGNGQKISLNSKDLNKTFEDITNSTKNDVTKKLDTEIQKLQDTANKNMLNAVEKFNTEVEGVRDRVNNNIVKRGEVLMDRAETEFNSVIAVKNKLIGYIFIAKIILSVLLFGFGLLIFFLWFGYKKVKNLTKSMAGFNNIDNNTKLEEKFDRIEKKLDEIISKLKK